MRIRIVFEGRNRGTFVDMSGKTVPKKNNLLKNESLKSEVLQRLGVSDLCWFVRVRETESEEIMTKDNDMKDNEEIMTSRS